MMVQFLEHPFIVSLNELKGLDPRRLQNFLQFPFNLRIVVPHFSLNLYFTTRTTGATRTTGTASTLCTDCKYYK